MRVRMTTSFSKLSDAGILTMIADFLWHHGYDRAADTIYAALEAEGAAKGTPDGSGAQAA